MGDKGFKSMFLGLGLGVLDSGLLGGTTSAGMARPSSSTSVNLFLIECIQLLFVLERLYGGLINEDASVTEAELDLELEDRVLSVEHRHKPFGRLLLRP